MATMCDDLFSLRLFIHDRLDGEGLLFIDFDFVTLWFIGTYLFWCSYSGFIDTCT